MRAEHLAIDGSVVTVDADADLSTRTTAAGWAIVPSLMQTHPFTASPRGHSKVVEESVKANFSQVEFVDEEEFSVKDGNLRVFLVEVPRSVGGARRLTVGAWEGRGGCLSTSMLGDERKRIVEVFDTLPFSQESRGIKIDAQVAPQPRAPEVIKEIPELGVLSIRPAISNVLEHVPKTRGHRTAHGEVFRVRETSRALMFVTASAVVNVGPTKDTDEGEMLSVMEELQVGWSPRAATPGN